VWIGTDVAAGGVGLTLGQLAFGAPVAITNYIGATGDGVHGNWLERLSKTQKTFAVPVKINEGNGFTLGNGTALTQMKIYNVPNAPAKEVPAQSCSDSTEKVKGITKADQVTGITPPAKLGNLSLNAYPGDDGLVILHFCNPSNHAVTTPAGVYSFLSVR
jgi:hypothetical protein